MRLDAARLGSSALVTHGTIDWSGENGCIFLTSMARGGWRCMNVMSPCTSQSARKSGEGEHSSGGNQDAGSIRLLACYTFEKRDIFEDLLSLSPFLCVCLSFLF